MISSGSKPISTEKQPGGAAPVFQRLDYADFDALRLIVDARWERFKPILQNQKHFNMYMDRLGALRNTMMHSRKLLPFEQALVIGMTGEIMNQVTLWREQGPDMKYFPEITSIEDSFGMHLRHGMITETIVRPGQTVTFTCAATDAHGRLLQWDLLVQSRRNSVIPEDSRKGDEVTLTWEVVDNHVRENADSQIRLWSDGKYHRHGEWDDYFLVHYHVLPPLVGESRDLPDELTGE